MTDWDDLRYFLALARHGTFSAAARVLGVSQPTMGRRLDAFQGRMGTTLFRRTPSGHALTAAGREVRARAESMERDVLALERAATGRDTDLVGPVRVTTTKWFAAAVLPNILGSLGVRHPGLVVDVAASAGWMSLTRREADVALRFTQFDDVDVVQRKVARVTFGLYASRSYLDARGTPDFELGCPGHFLATFNEQVTTASDGAYLDTIAHAAQIAFRSNSRDAIARAAAAGAGIASLPDHLGLRTPGLCRLSPPQPPARTVWLGFHADSKGLSRVRAVTRAIAEGLSRIHHELAPSTTSQKASPE